MSGWINEGPYYLWDTPGNQVWAARKAQELSEKYGVITETTLLEPGIFEVPGDYGVITRNEVPDNAHSPGCRCKKCDPPFEKIPYS